MKIYLSGAITAPTTKQFKENIDRFRRKATELRALGWEVHDPTDPQNEQPGQTWEHYLARDLYAIEHDGIEAVYLMKNWQESKGARLEAEYAKLLGLKIIVEVE